MDVIVDAEREESVEDRLGRLAPLTGVIFVVLLVVAIVTGGGETPGANASPAKVIAYYGSHRSELETSSIFIALAFLFLLFFAGSLRSYLRRTPGAEGLAAVVLAGGVLMTVGAFLGGSMEYALAHNLKHLTPQTAQTLSVLGNELFLPLIGGACVFGLASGLAILRGARLPRWLGWVAIVIAIAVVIPPVSFPVLLLFVIWSLIVSVLMYQRTGSPVSVAPADSPALAAASVD